MNIFLVVEIPMIAAIDAEADLHMARGIMEDIEKEALVPEDVRLMRMQNFKSLDETQEMFRTFRSFSWNNWTENLFRGLRVRCGVVELRSRSCSSTPGFLFKL